MSGRYVSSAAGYRCAFLDRLRDVTGGHPFWKPAPR
jgi:hypothetical protein